MTTDDGRGNDAPDDSSAPEPSQPRRPVPRHASEPDVESTPTTDGEHDPFAGAEWATTRPRRSEQPTTRPGMKRIRKRLPSQRRLRRRRRIGIVLLVAGALVVLGGIWLAVTAFMARGKLETARTQVAALRVQISRGDLDAATATARSLRGVASDAHDLTTGPVWSAAAAVPGLRAVDTVRTIAAQVDVLANGVLPKLITASDALDPAKLRSSDGSIDLARIAGVAPALDSATERIDDAARAVAASSPDNGISQVDEARSSLLDQLDSLGRTLHSADLASHIAPAMLGQNGTKRYFVAFQNNAEARGTGGLPGAFAILRADHGKVSFERFGSDSELVGVQAKVDFGEGYNAMYPDNLTTGEYRNANLSPNFPYAAQIWMSMWQVKTGESLDGAFALDPEALSYLLQITGPTTIPGAGGGQLSAANVVALTQQTAYTRFGNDQGARKKFLLAIAKAASRKIVDSRADPAALVRAGSRAAGERRLLAYSSDPAVQNDLAQTSLAGAIPETNAPYVGLSVANYASNKLDYYLDRSITWRRTGCGATRDVTVTIKLHNGAPAGLKSYVAGAPDKSDPQWRRGDTRIAVSYYATAGARVLFSGYDGRATSPSLHELLGHPVVTSEVTVRRGTTRTLTLRLREPAGSGAPIVLRQPLVRPLAVTIDDAKC